MRVQFVCRSLYVLARNPRLRSHSVAAATRFSVLTRSLQRLASAMKAHAATGIKVKGGRRVLTIEGTDYEVDGIYSQEVIKTIDELIAKGIKSGEKVGMWEQVIQDMYDGSIAWDESSQPDQTGVHPGNRSTFGVGGTESQHLGFAILSVGWSWNKCKDATAIQTPPIPLNVEAKAYNNMLVDMSDGLIPQLRLMRCLTIGGGHTNVWLRQCNGRVTCILGKDSDYADAKGKLCPEKLSIGRPLFAEALKDGLKYRMIHWQAPYIFPDLVEFAQSALNTEVRGGQSEIEILLVLHQLAHAATSRGEQISWPKIEEQACKSMPQCKPWIAALSSYVSVNAGGTEGQLLKELAQYAKAFGSGEKGPSRVLGSEFLSKLANLNFGAGQRHPYLLNACIETQLVAPPNRIIDGVCRLLLPTSLNDLTKKEARQSIINAEGMMTQARSLCQKLNVTGVAKIKAVGKMDVRIIGFLTKKGREFEGHEYNSIGEIVEIFLADVSKVVGKKITFSGTVDSDAPASSGGGAAAPAAEQTQSMQSVEQMQSKVYQAQHLGLTPDAFVIERGVEEPAIWQIEKYNGDMVVMRKHELGRHTGSRSIHVDVLLETWRLHKGTVTVLLPGYSFDDKTSSPRSSVAWKFDNAKAAVSIALMSVYAKMEPMGKAIDLFLKPSMARASVAMKAGSLMLAPASTRIDRRDSASAICVGKFDIGGSKPEPLFITPQFMAPLNANGEPNKQPFVRIFWQVANAPTKQTANMSLKCLIYEVNDVPVRVPVLVNSKDIAAGDELLWEKATGTVFGTMRSMVTFTDYTTAAKRRKLN